MQQIAYFVPLFLLVFGLSASVDVRQAWVERKTVREGRCLWPALPIRVAAVPRVLRGEDL